MVDRRLKRSQAQEAAGAKRWGGVRHPGSGNGWAKKNDVSSRRPPGDRALLIGDLVEFKDTSNKRSIKLDDVDLKGVAHNADTTGRRPVLGFHLAGTDYVVLRDTDYQEIRFALGENAE